MNRLFTGKLKLDEKETQEEIYVAHKLRRLVLGAPAIEALGLVKQISQVDRERLLLQRRVSIIIFRIGKVN